MKELIPIYLIQIFKKTRYSKLSGKTKQSEKLFFSLNTRIKRKNLSSRMFCQENNNSEKSVIHKNIVTTQISVQIRPDQFVL